MKQFARNFLSIALLVVFAFGQFQVFAVSADNDLEFDPSLSQEYLIRQLPDDDTGIAFSASAKKFFSSGTVSSNDSFLFYDQLDSYQKQIYTACEKAFISDTVTIKFTSKLEYTTSVILGPSALYKYLANQTAAALTALIDDRPDFFWISGFEIEDFDATVTASSKKLSYSVSSMQISISISKSAYGDFENVKLVYDDLMDDVENFQVEGYTRYEKVKYIHDAICKLASYDPNYNNSKANPTDHEAVSVFNEPYLTVCEGYSEAFKLICDREEIPCIIVIGNGGGGAHEWNYVQMEDGRWYVVDITWDDQEDHIFYDFFLSGSSTINGVFDSSAYYSSHIEDGTRFANISYSNSYPVLSLTSYSGALKYADSLSTEDNTAMRIFIDKNADLADQFYTKSNSDFKDSNGNTVNVMPSDYLITIKGVTTGATVKISNTVKAESKKYTVSRWGDVNSDNSVDMDDYDLIIAAVEGDNVISDKSQFDAADFNHDGVIDGFDALYMECYLNGEVSK